MLSRPLHEYAVLPSQLGRQHATAKLLLLLGFILAVVTAPFPSPFTFTSAFVLLLLAFPATPLPLWQWLRGLMLLIPLLAGVALFAPFHHEGSGAGLTLLASVAIKSLLTMSASIFLVATTPFPELTQAMERLKVPRVLVLIFNLTYRYLHLLLEEARRMQRARDARGFHPRHLGQATLIGQMSGTLFLRSYERAERVHQAMLSRGHSLALPPFQTAAPWSKGDVALLILPLALLAASRCLPFLS